MSIEWRPEALDSLEHILVRIDANDPAAADRLNEQIERLLGLLAVSPKMFQRGRVEGTREMVVHPNYIVIYRVTPDAVVVDDVLHARQQYP